MNTLVSSAHNIRFNRLETLLMSLMYSKKNRGPRIEPRGTPQEIITRNPRHRSYFTSLGLKTWWRKNYKEMYGIKINIRITDL